MPEHMDIKEILLKILANQIQNNFYLSQITLFQQGKVLDDEDKKKLLEETLIEYQKIYSVLKRN